MVQTNFKRLESSSIESNELAVSYGHVNIKNALLQYCSSDGMLLYAVNQVQKLLAGYLGLVYGYGCHKKFTSCCYKVVGPYPRIVQLTMHHIIVIGHAALVFRSNCNKTATLFAVTHD